MAAITYWVDGAVGDDTTGDGSFALPFATVGKGLTEIDDDANGNDFTLNVMNTATYVMPALATGVTVEAHSTSTLVIQGVSDENETPAHVTVAAPATGACIFAAIRTVLLTTIRGFIVDFSPSVASATGQVFVTYQDSDGGPIHISDCAFIGSTTSAAPAGFRAAYDLTGTARADLGTLSYCYFRNMQGPSVDAQGVPARAFQFHHNVYYWSAAATSPAFLTNAAGTSASNDVRVYNNTVYIDISNAAASALGAWMTHPALAGDNGRMDVYNNVIWVNHVRAGTAITVVFDSSGTGSYSSGTIGYNILYTGANVAAGDVAAWYDAAPWAPPYTGDQIAYEQAATVLFVDPTSTRAWIMSGVGYSYSLPDLRLLIHSEDGVGGALPGALPAYVEDIDPGEGDDPDDPENPEGTAQIPYLDVLPIFTTTLDLALNMRLGRTTNRARAQYLRDDIEERKWREFSAKRINLSTNMTTQLSMGGVQFGDFLFVVSDTVINVSVGNTSNLYVPAKVVVLSDGDFDQIWLQNPSTTTEADVLVGVVD